MSFCPFCWPCAASGRHRSAKSLAVKNAMRRLPLVLGLLLIVAMTALEVYDFFVTNEGVRYFSSQPRRSVYVMLFGVAGAIVAFGISRVSPDSQRKLKLAVLAGFGALLTFLTAALAFSACLLAWAGPTVTESGIWGWMVADFLLLPVAVTLVWWEFRQVWRQT